MIKKTAAIWDHAAPDTFLASMTDDYYEAFLQELMVPPSRKTEEQSDEG